MEEHKFSNSNLDFNELFDKYKNLNTTYSDIDDFKINIYENCNLLQDLTTVTTGTAFTVPSTNIRLSSFKNNYIIADTQTLDLNQAFYIANPDLFTTVENGTYFNNIDLTTIIKTHFNYANDDIYPSKKIIITINLLKEIVDTDGSGALQINMKEIKEHFHSLFDTLELDINQYATGKHGGLETTNTAPLDSRTGGRGQNGLDGGPAINITNNDDYPSFKLNIKTNSKVSGGFGASGGRGGNGKKNESAYTKSNPTGDTEYYVAWYKFVKVLSVLITSSPFQYYWKNTTIYCWNGILTEYPMENITIENALDTVRPTLTPTSYPETLSFPETYNAATNVYTKQLYRYAPGTAVPGTQSVWKIMKLEYTATKTGAVVPTSGTDGSTATYSHNAGNVFNTQVGSTGTPNDGTGGAGGAGGNPGGITNITTATNISIT